MIRLRIYIDGRLFVSGRSGASIATIRDLMIDVLPELQKLGHVTIVADDDGCVAGMFTVPKTVAA